MKIGLAFQHIIKKESSLMDKFNTKMIQIWTRSKYFHVEVIIGNKWISSGPTHGGVYIKDLEPLNEKLYDYKYIDLDISDNELKNIFQFLKNQEGTGYDWLGIFLSQGLPLHIDNKKEWFCSEIVAEILKRLNYDKIIKEVNQYSPKDIFNLVK